MFPNPYDTIYHLLAARSRGDVAAALACYEPGATVVLQPGNIASGEAAIKTYTQTTMSLPITFGGREIVEADGIALHVSQWTLQTDTGDKISGRTSDVLRRQSDGNWLLLIDNPWGTQLLDAVAQL